jgi:hypothetical protein
MDYKVLYVWYFTISETSSFVPEKQVALFLRNKSKGPSIEVTMLLCNDSCDFDQTYLTTMPSVFLTEKVV